MHPNNKPSFTRLIKQSGIYAIGNVAIKLSGLILAPLYLHPDYLSQIEFGQLILLEGIALIAILIAGLGIVNGLLKYYTDPEYESRRSVLSFTAFTASLFFSIIVLGICAYLSPFFSKVILGDPALSDMLRLILIYIFFKVVGQVPFMVLRVNEKAGLYVFVLVLELILLIGGVIYFLTSMQLGLQGVLYAYIISSAASAVFISLGVLYRVTWKIDRMMVLKLIGFGVPLVVAGLVSQFLYVGNRFFLNWFTDPETVAIFGWGARLSGVINIIVVQSFNLAFSVLGLKALGALEMDLNLYRRTFRHYVIITGAIVLLLSLFAYDITNLISANPNYLKSHVLILPLSLGFMSFGIFSMGMNVLYARGKSKLISVLFLFSAIVYIVANILLIPSFGSMGAAIATLIAYIFLSISTIIFAERNIRIRYPWKILIGVLGFVVILYLFSIPTLSGDLLLRIVSRVLLIVLYGVMIIVAGFYSMDEIKKGFHEIRLKIVSGK